MRVCSNKLFSYQNHWTVHLINNGKKKLRQFSFASMWQYTKQVNNITKIKSWLLNQYQNVVEEISNHQDPTENQVITSLQQHVGFLNSSMGRLGPLFQVVFKK